MRLAEFYTLVRSDWRSNPGYSLDALKARALLLLVRLEQFIYSWKCATRGVLPAMIWMIARFVGSVLQWRLFNCQISGMVDIGKGLRLPHPQNIIIGMKTQLGDYCSVYHNVTFARSTFEPGVKMATVGDRVLIGAGVIIMGEVQIGDDAVIAAGAVVTKDVPRAHIAYSPSLLIRARKEADPPAEEMAGRAGNYPNPHPLASGRRTYP